MKEIKNWEAIIKDEKGNEEIAILLPGCIVKGEIEEKEVEIQTIDVDISNLIITGSDQKKYLLSGANRIYLNNLETCMKVGKKQRDGEER